MDLVAAFSQMQQANVLSQVDVAVASKILQVEKGQGNTALALLQSAENSANSAGDEMVAAATGLGSQIDVRA